MLELHCSDLWDRISQLAQSSKRRQAAVAFVSDDSRIQFGAGDTLVLDASLDKIIGGLTSAKVLHRAFKRGAEIFSCPNLHAKVYVFDGTVVIGSSNTSASSTQRLLEAAIITDEASLTSSARNLILELRLKSQPLLSTDIQKLLEIPVERRRPFGRRSPAPTINPSPGETWLVATHPVERDLNGEEQELLQQGLKLAATRFEKHSSEVDSISFPQNAYISKNAKEGDWIIQMKLSKRDGAFTRVSAPVPIRYKQNEGKYTRIYIEEFANLGSNGLGWSTFRRIAEKAGVPERRLRKRSVGLLTKYQAEALESSWKAQSRASNK